MTHEVRVLCDCDDIELCQIELYVSDVRLAVAVIESLRQKLSEAVVLAP